MYTLQSVLRPIQKARRPEAIERSRLKKLDKKDWKIRLRSNRKPSEKRQQQIARETTIKTHTKRKMYP